MFEATSNAGIEAAMAQRLTVNGNSKLSLKTAYLYELYETNPIGVDKFLKNGITQNMDTRYANNYMKGKYMKEIANGTRSEILMLERQRTIANPGPLNLERWLQNYRNGQ